jgi:hypothetical protein
VRWRPSGFRADRDADTKHRMLHTCTDLIVRVARVPVDDVMVAFIETPFENVMEAAVRLPAPASRQFLDVSKPDVRNTGAATELNLATLLRESSPIGN